MLNFSTVTSARACCTAFCTPSWIIFWRSPSCACSKLGGSASALLLELDDVPAELGLHRLVGDLPGLQRERGGGEGRHHLVLLEPAEIAALGRAGVLAVLLRERGEIRALLQFGDDLLGLVLGGHQDVARVHLLLARLAGDVLVVAGTDRLPRSRWGRPACSAARSAARNPRRARSGAAPPDPCRARSCAPPAPAPCGRSAGPAASGTGSAAGCCATPAAASGPPG